MKVSPVGNVTTKLPLPSGATVAVVPFGSVMDVVEEVKPPCGAVTVIVVPVTGPVPVVFVLPVVIVSVVVPPLTIVVTIFVCAALVAPWTVVALAVCVSVTFACAGENASAPNTNAAAANLHVLSIIIKQPKIPEVQPVLYKHSAVKYNLITMASADFA